jgi:uncharacterized protein YndB with AHSA1/START domain
MSTQSERAGYRPGSAGEAHVEEERDGRYTLVYVRRLGRAPERVWGALTHPEALREWAPFDATHDLGTPGTTTLTLAGGDRPIDLPSHVRRAEAPRRLEYTFGTDVLRWELEPAGGGTRLTLRHTVNDWHFVPKVAAGWQICLDVAERYLAGRPIGRIVADEAKRFEWERLRAEYALHLAPEEELIHA